MNSLNMETRISVLENDMEWSKSNIDRIYIELAEIKTDLATFQKATDRNFIEVHKEIGSLRGEIGVLRGDLASETSKIRSDLRSEIADLRTELKVEISDLRDEVKTEISSLRTDMGNLRGEMGIRFADVHKAIAIQTRWILTGILSAATLITMGSPILTHFLQRLE